MRKSLQRIWSLSIKEFIHLRNDWWLPAFMILGGVLELVAIGWATSRPISNLPLMVLDQDRSPASREVITALENTGTFELDSYVGDMQSIEQALELGQINAAVIIPPDFGGEIASSSGQATLAVILNGAESIPATSALRAIEGVSREMGQEILLERLGSGDDALAEFEPSLRVWFNESLNEALYTTPAEAALMLEFTVLLFAALSFSRERELGTLEQLLVMPFSSLEIIIGKSIPVMVIGFVDFLLMLAMVHFVFDVPIRGSLALLLILAVGYLMVELGKGLVISVISKTQHQAFLVVMVIGMMDFMFTGYAVPVESMPEFMQSVANLIPAHHWLAIVRGIMLKGAGLDALWPHILLLAILGLVIGTFSLRFVRRALD
ncbi:MAG: ABC transporter permease [Chloroflexi bacterium]|nr:MAG: ABC transporter permease [Chloroflexota bacterium]MBL1195514.1 ABC transporter permease [Chloroflexota bacterium]NOH12796.1 ABC transporter permease [Chloroflexota bacterium]